MLNKKAISPIVTTALLLLVAVTAVITFQSWYKTYQSEVMTDIDQQSQGSNKITIQSIVGDTLYLKSNQAETFSILKIVDSKGNIMCEIKDGIESSLKADTRLLMNFDDGTATDLSGYGNHGTLNGGMNCDVVGISGNGCSFDGINDYIEIINSSSINFESNEFEFSLNIWSLPTSSKNSVYPEDLAVLINKGYYIYRADNSDISFNYFDAETGWLLTNGAGNKINNWQNVVATYKPLNLTHTNINLYLDGIKVDSEIKLKQKFDLNLFIGNSVGSLRHFNGTIDEVAIYSKAVTDSEVKALYNAKKAKYYEQILGNDIKKIDVKNCNLNSNYLYNVIGFTKSGKVEKMVMTK